MAENEHGWLENELRHQLRPVAAPAGLWDRIQLSPMTGVPAPHPPLRPFWFMPVFATLLVFMTAGLLWGIRQSRTHLRDIALSDQELRVLADSSNGQTYPSDDPIQIRNWVKRHSNIDIELPTSRSEAIHLLGAKLVQSRGSLIAAVAYKVGADSATLIVSRRNGNAGSKHLISRVNTAGGTSLLSWNMREQAYTIAWAGVGDPCLLCHAGVHGRM